MAQWCWKRCPIPYRALSNVVEGVVLEEAVSERMGFAALAGGSVVYESKGDIAPHGKMYSLPSVSERQSNSQEAGY
jgi:hypothetical protein